MEIQIEMPITDKDAQMGVFDALGVDIGELLAIEHDEARRKEMELVGDSIGLLRVNCVVTVRYRL
ncbi:uncharacterized protein TrAtP1_011113 [Trichoderma atroviride]|uniref:uncharacterized protein n=1 Tax=Hypocrea atroviridis TaxID=63577 RepID=UPI0033300EC4|nr:hypothetical protein TrAtP1_011113 [Trichoderma atroviride]